MPTHLTGAGNSIFVRLQLENRPGTFARVAAAIAEAGGNLGAIDTPTADGPHLTREIAIECGDDEHARRIVGALRKVDGAHLVSYSDRVFRMHRGGKIEVTPKMPVNSVQNLSMAYTPGVARICRAIAEDEELADALTIRKNTVAVVTDGTAVLGLGDIGPKAALPVMEGKAMLFKEFGRVDAFPVCLDTTDPDEIVDTVKRLAPGFGGINLEDISAPRCFEIERRLKAELDIPVFHDDQHGTAVVALAALINALKIVGKSMNELRVVVCGAGAAGVAIVKILQAAGVPWIVVTDRAGCLVVGRGEHMNPVKEELARITNPDHIEGPIDRAAEQADVLIGVSTPGAFTIDTVKAMADDAIVFALANPDPEVSPEEAAEVARIVATGRSDYPNQINNVLCFPGLFRGALDCRATDITEGMKQAAAEAIAASVEEKYLSEEYIIPSVFKKHVSRRVARAVMRAAKKEGVSRPAPTVRHG